MIGSRLLHKLIGEHTSSIRINPGWPPRHQNTENLPIQITLRSPFVKAQNISVTMKLLHKHVH